MIAYCPLRPSIMSEAWPGWSEEAGFWVIVWERKRVVGGTNAIARRLTPLLPKAEAMAFSAMLEALAGEAEVTVAGWQALAGLVRAAPEA